MHRAMPLAVGGDWHDRRRITVLSEAPRPESLQTEAASRLSALKARSWMHSSRCYSCRRIPLGSTASAPDTLARAASTAAIGSTDRARAVPNEQSFLGSSGRFFR